MHVHVYEKFLTLICVNKR